MTDNGMNEGGEVLLAPDSAGVGTNKAASDGGNGKRKPRRPSNAKKKLNSVATDNERPAVASANEGAGKAKQRRLPRKRPITKADTTVMPEQFAKTAAAKTGARKASNKTNPKQENKATAKKPEVKANASAKKEKNKSSRAKKQKDVAQAMSILQYPTFAINLPAADSQHHPSAGRKRLRSLHSRPSHDHPFPHEAA